MDTFILVLSKFSDLFQFEIILVIILGCILGLFVGALPGLSSATGMVILLPVTYFMDTEHAIAILVSLYISSLVAGGINAVFFNIPGEPSAAVTAIDGYPLAQSGKHNQAAGLVIGSSFVGGLLSFLMLIFLVDFFGRIATEFGSIELFLVAFLGMVAASAIKGEQPIKGLISGFLGFLIGTIGLSPSGVSRADFNINYLMDGVPYLPILIGMLAMSEVFKMLDKETVSPKTINTKRSFKKILQGVIYPIKKPIVVGLGSIIGSIVGALPAQGATMASFLSYSNAKQYFNKNNDFGKGSPVGLVASETANNASIGGGLLTTLLLGIPGTASAAILLGALLLHGIQPGPLIIEQHGDILYSLLSILIIANMFMIIIAIVLAYFYSSFLFVPTKYLAPIIMIFCTIGSYSVRYYSFDILLMIIFGIFAWQISKRGYVPIAVVVGVIVAPIADSELIRAINIHGGNILQSTLQSPIAIILIILIILFTINMFMPRKSKQA